MQYSCIMAFYNSHIKENANQIICIKSWQNFHDKTDKIFNKIQTWMGINMAKSLSNSLCINQKKKKDFFQFWLRVLWLITLLQSVCVSIKCLVAIKYYLNYYSTYIFCHWRNLLLFEFLSVIFLWTEFSFNSSTVFKAGIFISFL